MQAVVHPGNGIGKELRLGLEAWSLGSGIRGRRFLERHLGLVVTRVHRMAPDCLSSRVVSLMQLCLILKEKLQIGFTGEVVSF